MDALLVTLASTNLLPWVPWQSPQCIGHACMGRKQGFSVQCV